MQCGAAAPSAQPHPSPPYTGLVPIHSGEIAEDLARYLADSEQVNSALALGVSVFGNGQVRVAGGYLVQLLPFASEETLTALERSLNGLPSITEMLQSGMDAYAITDRLLGDLGPALTEDQSHLVPAYGPCDEADLKRRMRRAVVSLGEEEVTSIVAEHGHVEVACEFCKMSATFSVEDVFPSGMPDGEAPSAA